MKSTKASMSSRGPPSLESVWRQFNLKRTTSVTRVNKKSENERLKISKFPGIFEALELFFCKPKLRILQFSKFPTFHEVPKVPNFYFIRLEFVQFLWHSFGATEAHLKPPCYLKKSSLHAYIKTNLSILVLFWRFDLAKNVIAISKWNLSRFRFANADGQCTANAGKSVDLANLFKSIVPQCSTPILDCDWFLPHNSMSYTILKKRLGNRLAKRCGPQTRVAAISIGNRLSKLQSKTPNIDAALQDHGSDSHTTWSTQAYCVQHLLIQGKPPPAQASKHSYRLTCGDQNIGRERLKSHPKPKGQNRLAVDNSRQTRELHCQSHATSKKSLRHKSARKILWITLMQATAIFQLSSYSCSPYTLQIAIKRLESYYLIRTQTIWGPRSHGFFFCSGCEHRRA